MKKSLFLLLLVIVCSVNLFAQNVRLVVDVTHVVVNDGKVYLALFSNADAFRRERPCFVFELNSTRTTLSQEVNLPPGDYLISAFQDKNGNGDLDFNLLGVPTELVGISNYNGRGFPTRNFNRHKVPVNETTERVTVRLHKFW